MLIRIKMSIENLSSNMNIRELRIGKDLQRFTKMNVNYRVKVRIHSFKAGEHNFGMKKNKIFFI